MKIALLALLLTVVIAVIIYAIVRLIKRDNDGSNFLTQTRVSIMDREVQIVCRFIEENYADVDLNLEKICVELSTGESFVEALFKKELDMRVEEFISHVRVHHAVNLVNEGFTGNYSELMEFCGYQDINQFKRDFKTIAGVSLDSVLGE